MVTPRPPMTPAVLVGIDRNSRVYILQDEQVQVVLLDERTDPDVVILLPMRDQAEEMLHVLGDKYPASRSADIGQTAVNALAQLYHRRIIVGALEPDAALLKITKAQEAQR